MQTWQHTLSSFHHDVPLAINQMAAEPVWDNWIGTCGKTTKIHSSHHNRYWSIASSEWTNMKKVGETFAVSHMFEWIFNRGEKKTFVPIITHVHRYWHWGHFGHETTCLATMAMRNHRSKSCWYLHSATQYPLPWAIWDFRRSDYSGGLCGKAQRSSVDGGFNRSEKSLSKIIILYIYIYIFRSPGQKAVNLSQHISLNNQ